MALSSRKPLAGWVDLGDPVAAGRLRIPACSAWSSPNRAVLSASHGSVAEATTHLHIGAHSLTGID